MDTGDGDLFRNDWGENKKKEEEKKERVVPQQKKNSRWTIRSKTCGKTEGGRSFPSPNPKKNKQKKTRKNVEKK